MMDALFVEDTSLTKTKVIEIDGDGDVVFELSSPKLADGKTHLVVSSKALSLVSPVIEKVFAWDAQARQGKIPSASESLATLVPENRPTSKSRTPPVIALPEDDTETFTLLCKITHHQMHGVPAALAPDSFAKFASMCHKYDCIEAVSHSSFRWFQAIATETHNAGELNKLLFAAFVLDTPETFERISAMILLLHKGPFLQLPGFTDHVLAPPGLLGTIKKQRRSFWLLTEFNVAEFAAKHATLTMELRSAAQRIIGKSGGCLSASSRIEYYNETLQMDELWFSPNAYLNQQEHCLDLLFTKRVSEPYGQYCNGGKGCSRCNKYRQYSFNEEFSREKEKVLKGPIGLCLDCVSTGRESFRTKECRIKHAVSLDNAEDHGQGKKVRKIFQR